LQGKTGKGGVTYFCMSVEKRRRWCGDYYRGKSHGFRAPSKGAGGAVYLAPRKRAGGGKGLGENLWITGGVSTPSD